MKYVGVRMSVRHRLTRQRQKAKLRISYIYPGQSRNLILPAHYSGWADVTLSSIVFLKRDLRPKHALPSLAWQANNCFQSHQLILVWLRHLFPLSYYLSCQAFYSKPYKHTEPPFASYYTVIYNIDFTSVSLQFVISKAGEKVID